MIRVVFFDGRKYETIAYMPTFDDACQWLTHVYFGPDKGNVGGDIYGYDEDDDDKRSLLIGDCQMYSVESQAQIRELCDLVLNERDPRRAIELARRIRMLWS